MEHHQVIDGIEYRMKEPFDMSFLTKYGSVFKVFDDQDSGNICFGVDDGQARRFVKFAGAPTAEYTGTPENAVERLKRTVPIYQELAHDVLIRYLFSEEIGGGFAVVFDWVDGECMGKQYPESRRKFLTASMEVRLDIFKDVIRFHRHTIERGYVAIDFYDGSILYDFAAQCTHICDIDFYEKRPVVNAMGRMWGSSRFMSTEEFSLGATIDEVTNVFLMGAVAFALFGGEKDRSIEKWMLTEKTHQVALTAVSDEREKRYPTIEAFAEAWERAAIEQ